MITVTETDLWTPFQKCEIGGFHIVTASRAELAAAMVADCQATRPHRDKIPPRLVFDANGQALSLRQTDPVYRRAVDQCDVVHADGGFLVTLSRLLTKRPIAERSATTDMIHDFARQAAGNGITFYLLGGSDSINAEAARRLTARYQGLDIVGRHHGYFSQDEEAVLVGEINKTRPDVLWVGLGKPKEQNFSVKWKDRLAAGWLVTCGGCYNFITGDYPRAPTFMQQSNLEWLHRLATNPRKLFWRYLVTNPHALWLALTKQHS